jgi:hypothetical protein
MGAVNRTTWGRGLLAALLTTAAAGCWTWPSGHTFSRNYGLRGDVPADPPGCGAEDRDCLEGGRLYKLYCGYCHNARPLGERPFSNNEVALAHMREQAYLTGREHRQILHYLRRWHDLGPPTPDVEPSPKRFFYGQPVNELKPKDEAAAAPEAPAP